jgi:hypothetical protein
MNAKGIFVLLGPVPGLIDSNRIVERIQEEKGYS